MPIVYLALPTLCSLHRPNNVSWEDVLVQCAISVLGGQGRPGRCTVLAVSSPLLSFPAAAAGQREAATIDRLASAWSQVYCPHEAAHCLHRIGNQDYLEFSTLLFMTQTGTRDNLETLMYISYLHVTWRHRSVQCTSWNRYNLWINISSK